MLASELLPQCTIPDLCTNKADIFHNMQAFPLKIQQPRTSGTIVLLIGRSTAPSHQRSSITTHKSGILGTIRSALTPRCTSIISQGCP